MKSAELLRLYEHGRRDFRGENLRGQNFKGKDLSGVDFSGADIRSANFTHANLRGANLSNVKAGLQRRWVAGQLTLITIIAGIVGYVQGTATYEIGVLISGNRIDSPAAIVGLIVILVCCFIIGCQGFTLEALGNIAVTFAISFFGVGFFAGSISAAVSVPVVVVLVSSVFIAGTVFAASATSAVGAIFTALIASFASAISGGVTYLSIIVILLLSVYVNRRIYKKDLKFENLRIVSFAFATLGGTTFSGADLTDATFAHARLKSTNFANSRQRPTILTHVRWHHSQRIDRARLGTSNLQDPRVRTLLTTLDGIDQDLTNADLRSVNLAGAKLQRITLTGANLNGATLQGAELYEATLTEAQCVGTDFNGAQLTGACLEAWNIDNTTQLDGAICEYVYLLNNQQERRPSSGMFEQGEFTKLFEEVLDTIDLIFRNGLDWKAFVAAFDKVRVENGDTELGIQSIENKGDGVMVVKLQASPDADKDKIHQAMMTEYDIALKAIEEKYRTELNAKDTEISIYRQQSADLMEIAKLQASRPINVEARAEAMAEKDTNTTNINAQTIGVANTGSGNVSDFTQSINTPEAKQTLAEAAAEIQALLKQLEETAPAESMSEKMALATTAIAQIETNPTLKQRAVAALAAGGMKAFEKTIDHPVAAFVVGAIEEWKKGE